VDHHGRADPRQGAAGATSPPPAANWFNQVDWRFTLGVLWKIGIIPPDCRCVFESLARIRVVGLGVGAHTPGIHRMSTYRKSTPGSGQCQVERVLLGLVSGGAWSR